MVIPFLFWIVSKSSFWIEIFKFSFMRIIGGYKVYVYFCLLVSFIFLMLLMNSFDVVTFSIKSCRAISSTKSWLFICSILRLKDRLVNKRRYISLSNLIAITWTIPTTVSFHLFSLKINKINFIVNSSS